MTINGVIDFYFERAFVPISHKQAQSICDDIVNKFDSWPMKMAAMQAGGLEQKCHTIVENVLSNIFTGKNSLGVLAEFKDMDFVLVDVASIGRPELVIDSVIECKFNYEKQAREFATRLNGSSASAVGQIALYKQNFGINNGYVLYLVVNFFGKKPFSSGVKHNAGWNYCVNTVPPPVVGTCFNNQMTLNGITLLGQATSMNGDFFCAIF